MYLPLKQDYIRRSLTPSNARTLNKAEHSRRVLSDLRDLGLSRFGLRSMEAKHLSHIIHPDEQLGGVVYGLHADGSVMLVATDRRIIFIDRKPLFTNEDEVKYNVVSGVGYGHVGLGTTVSLHTRIRDYVVRTLNQRSAERFVDFIKERCLEQSEESSYDQPV